MIVFLAKTPAGRHGSFSTHWLHGITRLAVSTCVALVAQLFDMPSLRAESSDRPNIVLILTDDQGYNDLGCFGSRTIRTPNLDRMASEGLRLTSFYAQPVCGVSRAALMTGCYPIRVGEPGNVKRLHTVPHPQEYTMAEMLRDAGYATALIGKWHLTQPKADGIAGFDPDTMPRAQGFDYFYGTPLYNGFTVFVEDAPFRSPIIRNDAIVTQAVESWDTITQDYTREALQWIERNQQQPFFVYLAHNMPHVPVGASPDFKGKSAYGPYGDTIEEIDWSCGQIFDKLKSLGLDENTLVIFTSDNGPWVETTRGMKPDSAKFIPRDHSGSAEPLRGWKMSAWDGGCRVPCLMRWPGKIAAGRQSDEILSTMDLMPTFASITGGAVAESIAMDGFDAKEFLLGKSDQSPRDEYLYYTGCLLTGVRSGQWKLVLPRPSNPPGTGWWGRMIEEVKETQLYDLDRDPGEKNNVADSHDEIVAALMQRIERARGELGDIDRIGSGARSFDNVLRRLQVPATPRNTRRVLHDKAPPVGELRYTFERGDLHGWTVVEGEMPDVVTDRIDLPNHQDRPFNKQGQYFLFTGNRKDQIRGNDQLTGVIESPGFTMRGTKISFLVGGGAGRQTYVSLVDEAGNEIRAASGNNTPIMKRVVWDLPDHVGKRMKVRIVDRSQKGWGHVTFDDFSADASSE